MTITEIDEKFMREALAEARAAAAVRCRSVARSLAPFRLYGLCDVGTLLHVRGPYGQRARGALRVWRE